MARNAVLIVALMVSAAWMMFVVGRMQSQPPQELQRPTPARAGPMGGVLDRPALTASPPCPPCKTQAVTQATTQVVTTGEPPRKDLVLAMAAGPKSMEGARIFLASLRAHNEDAEVVLCVDAPNKHLLEDLSVEFGVTLFVFDPTALALPWADYHPSNYRYEIYMQYLDSLGPRPHNHRFRRALLIDARDSAFQGDPMSIVTSPGLYAFQEEKPRTVAQCGWNRGWVTDCYHQGLYTTIKDNVILCSGTTVGSWNAVLKYMHVMHAELARSAFCERNGIDQGVHNVIIRAFAHVIHENVHIHTNEEGPIATVQSIPKAEVAKRFVNGQMHNKDGDKVVIIHQYDRSNVIASHLNRQWSPSS